jgi:hypothetical protein
MWWVMVGFETLRLRARSAEVVGARARIEAIAYLVVSPSALNTVSGLISRRGAGVISRAPRSSTPIWFAADASLILGK